MLVQHFTVGTYVNLGTYDWRHGCRHHAVDDAYHAEGVAPGTSSAMIVKGRVPLLHFEPHPSSSPKPTVSFQGSNVIVLEVGKVIWDRF
jgi:hypothetical protein